MMRKWIGGLLVMAVVGIAWAQQDKTPHQIIEETAQTMADQLDGRQEYLEENTDELYELINEVMYPYFDTRYAGRLVLGKHWQNVTAEQRSRFIDAFYGFLLRSYAKGVLEFDQNNINILPARGEQDEKRAVVKTEMRLDDGSEVPVNYSMRKTSTGWKVYDVRIEGISYIRNYRSQFNAEIAANGIDSVIQRMETETTAPDGDQT